MAYGYGLSVTPLQLAQAYAVLGAGGMRRPVSLRRVDVAVRRANACSTRQSRTSWCR